MCNSAAHNSRPGRESVSKRIGVRAVRAIATRDGGACLYCGATAQTSGAHLHLDHLTPRSQGGADDARNLVTACRRCNSARQDMSLAQWAAYAAVKLGLTIDPRAVRAHARRVQIAA